jgi:acetyl esterase
LVTYSHIVTVTMRVDSWPAARVVALAALLVAGSLLAGCAAQATPATSNNVRHVVARRAIAEPEHVTVIPNLTYGVASGVALQLDICLPTSPAHGASTLRPAIVAIHGGSWMVGDKAEPQWRSVCEWLASSGYVVASVDYRLAPAYVYPDQLADVESAVEWLRDPAQAKRFGIDPTLVGAFGGSAGGDLAAMLGTVGQGSLDRGHRVAAVAELSGPADLTAKGAEGDILKPRVLSYLGCTSYVSCPQADAASPIDNVDASDSPFFICNSSDELVPVSQSASLADRLKAVHVPVTFVTVPGTLHSISMLTPLLRERIVDFYRLALVHHPRGTATS